jgi:hypothetical protein
VKRDRFRAHGPVLAFLTLLFFLRVLGQALVVFFSVSWLPSAPFSFFSPSTEQWASGLIPYPTLLATQVVLLIGMVKIVSDVWRGKEFFAQPRMRLAGFLTSFSAIYAGSMLLRYVITMILRPEMRRFGGTIPIFFHFVLAAFLYTWGKFHACVVIFARPDRAC